MREQEKEIQITLTKEFHTTYWKNKTNYIYYSFIGMAAALFFMIIGVIFDALPKMTLASTGVFLALYCCMVMGVFAAGIYFGMGVVGKQISGRIHKEHPELFVELEKKDV